MKYKTFLLFATLLFAIFMMSCSNDSPEKRIEYAKIVEARTSQDLLNDLYVGSDADIEAIARVMNVTPSSIERMRNGETEPTAQFEERIHEVAIYYMQNGQSFSKLQSILDPEYKWYDSILNFPKHYPWIFWSITIIVILTGLLAFVIPVFFIDVIGAILGLLLFLIAWIASVFCSPEPIQDSYIDSINPTVEQIK